MKGFFSPKSIAVIGASRKSGKVGRVIYDNLRKRFKGKVYPVNPRAEEIGGERCYPSVKDVPGEVDLCVVAVPAPIVPGVLRECGEKGVKYAIVVSGGFKEVGREDLEEEVKRIVKEYGMRLIGPNCMGVYDSSSGVDTIFLGEERVKRPGKGRISVVSQSGALGSMILDWAGERGIGIAKFVSYGNAADVGEAELIEFLGRDGETGVICVYVEGVRGREFMEAVREASREKPVVVIKGGKSERGKQAVASHTGSLAGEYGIFRAAVEQSGGVVVESVEELMGFARAYLKIGEVKGNRVYVVTNGGGLGVLTTDLLERYGFVLMEERVEREGFPEHVVVGNPLDLTGDADDERYVLALERVLELKPDIVFLLVLPQLPGISEEFGRRVGEVVEGEKVVGVVAGGGFAEKVRKELEEYIPVFEFPEEAVKVVAKIREYAKRKKLIS